MSERISDLLARLRPQVEGSFGGALLDEIEAEIAHAQAGEESVLGINAGLRDEVELLRSGLEVLRDSPPADVGGFAAGIIEEADDLVAERPVPA